MVCPLLLPDGFFRWANYIIRLRGDILIPIFDGGLRVIADEKGEERNECER